MNTYETPLTFAKRRAVVAAILSPVVMIVWLAAHLLMDMPPALDRLLLYFCIASSLVMLSILAYSCQNYLREKRYAGNPAEKKAPIPAAETLCKYLAIALLVVAGLVVVLLLVPAIIAIDAK